MACAGAMFLRHGRKEGLDVIDWETQMIEINSYTARFLTLISSPAWAEMPVRCGTRARQPEVGYSKVVCTLSKEALCTCAGGPPLEISSFIIAVRTRLGSIELTGTTS